MDNIKIGGHEYRRREPSLSCIEKAIETADIKSRNVVNKGKISLALSILLIGDDTYQRQLSEAEDEELSRVFSKCLLGQIKKLSVCLSYIKAIESLAASE